MVWRGKDGVFWKTALAGGGTRLETVKRKTEQTHRIDCCLATGVMVPASSWWLRGTTDRPCPFDYDGVRLQDGDPGWTGTQSRNRGADSLGRSQRFRRPVSRAAR